MPRGIVTKNDLLSKLYKLKNELKDRKDTAESKYLADQYLNKVLDYLKEFSN